MVLKTARGKVAFLLVVSAVLAIFGIIVIAAGEGGTVIGILAVVFFGLLGVPALGWRLATGRPVTVIDYAGVAVYNVGVSWQDVLGVRVFGPKRLVLLDLTPQGQATMANQLRPWHRVVARVETQITGRPAFSFLPIRESLPSPSLPGWPGSIFSARAVSRRTPPPADLSSGLPRRARRQPLRLARTPRRHA